MATSEIQRIVVGRIGAAHGIKGEVRVKSFTAAALDLAAYGPLEAADGRSLTVKTARPAGASPDMLVVRFAGIDDRNQAEALTGLELTVPRERLPQPDEDEFYHADLIGLETVTADGAPLGRIVAVLNYGAGDLLEIARPEGGATLLIPFTRAVVPMIDLAARRVVIDPPMEVEGDDEDGEEWSGNGGGNGSGNGDGNGSS